LVFCCSTTQTPPAVCRFRYIEYIDGRSIGSKGKALLARYSLER
jgi:hypothetical protein